MDKLESPLEEIFYDDILVGYEILSMVLSCKSQFVIENKRYDFALEVVKGRFLLIECDGEQWHRQEKARLNDKYKNKLAQDCDVVLLRFTYWEIVKDTEMVANTLEGAIDLLKY